MSKWVRTINGALVNLAYIECVNSKPYDEEKKVFTVHAWCPDEGGCYILAQKLSRAEAEAMLDKLLAELNGEGRE